LSKFHSKYINKLNKHKKTVVELKDDNTSINLSNVCKYYYNKSISFKVLEGINLKIMKGEFAVILGPSGSGKTTLLNIISGMDSATYGQVDVCGTSLVNLTSNELTKFRKDNVGYIFQQYGLLPNLTVRENVEIGSSLQSDKSQRLDIDTVLKDLGIFDFKNKMPYELSGGQQQRVSIARSVAKNPRIIFADEPTGAIDEKMSKQIMQMLVDINKKYKTTVIIVTHNPIIAELATKIIIVENGDISKAINNKPKSVDEIK
jgi:putative ABC transport system ATP-binding protein